MTKFRVKYMNSWKEEKSIIIEGSYWTVFADAKMMFGEKNIISVEDLDATSTPIFKHLTNNDDEFYQFDD